jgi:hypothetical protein
MAASHLGNATQPAGRHLKMHRPRLSHKPFQPPQASLCDDDRNCARKFTAQVAESAD